jgi:phage I-like protein
MSQTVGFWVDMGAVTLSDTEPTWIQALPLGTYQHPVFGKLDITPERVNAFATSVSQKVLQKDLDIDYDHKAKVDHAAGWVKAAEARQDGLWIQIDWTPAARQKLKDREYRYFSPEFVDEWKHPKTQAVHKDVLLGGALTNRPFLKDILPINLSEVFENAIKEGDSMPTVKLTAEAALASLKELATKHGLDPEKATPEEILAAAQQGADDDDNDGDANNDADKDGDGTNGTDDDNQPGGEVVLSDTVRLSESQLKDPVVKMLAEALATQNKVMAEATKQIGVLAAANKLADVDSKITKLSDTQGGGRIVLSPAAKELAKKVMVGVPTSLSDDVYKLLELAAGGKATVELGERGLTSVGGEVNAAKQFSDEVDKVRTEKKLSYTDAVALVAREQPDLYTGYRTATLAGETIN